MSVYRTFCFAALFALPQMLPAAPLSANILGQVEATVNFCAQADTKSADKYKAIGKAMVGDMSDKEVADARGSKEYKENYDAITTELKKIPADKAGETCHSALQQDDK